MESKRFTFGEETAVIESRQTEKESGDLTATVALYSPNSGKCLMSLKSNLEKTVGEMKEMLAEELEVSANDITCEFKDGNKPDSTKLKDIDAGEPDELKFMLKITYKGETNVDKAKDDYKLPDVIKVKIPIEQSGSTDSSQWRFVSVAIIRDETALMRKPFLGGYRNTKSGSIYHHASVQTLPKGYTLHDREVAAKKFSRDTQTYKMKSIKLQTSCDTSTQMSKPGLYVSDAGDKVMVPGSYETADELIERKIKQVIIIQKYLKRWLATKKVKAMRMEQGRRMEWEVKESKRREEEREREMLKEQERRIHPSTKQDFELLYNSLRKWKKEEEDEINRKLSGAERKAALCMLLDREAELLAIISRLQKEAMEEGREHGIMRFFNEMSAPKTWKRLGDGKDVQMDTQETLRADHLKQLYITLKMKFQTSEERLDALLVLKNTVQEYYSKISNEILDLIERETTLILRGVNEEHLQGLRSRIITLFVQLTKDPIFNPQAAKCLKLPKHIRTLEQQYKKLKVDGASGDEAESNIQHSSVFKQPIHNEDTSFYRCLLNDIINSELQLGNEFSVVFIMQELDMKYLFEDVWECKSLLSLFDDPRELTFARWVVDEPWSPWNCILLTKMEAHAHTKIKDIHEVYGDDFVHKVNSKHTLAQSQLSHLHLLLVSQYNNSIRKKNASNKLRIEPDMADQTKCYV